MGAFRFSGFVAGTTLLIATAAGAGVVPQPGELLVSTGSADFGNVYQVDTASGAGTQHCTVGDFGPMTEIEFRDDGVLFGTTGGGSSALVIIDPSSCDETLVGNHPVGSLNGLEFVGGVLYGAFFEPDKQVSPDGVSPTSLVIVDTTDASLTTIDSLPYNPVRGLAWDAATSTLYGVGAPAQNLGFGDTLFTIDPGTGAASAIGPTGWQIGGIEFGPDGVLYGGAVTGLNETVVGGSAPLLTLDTATGVATPVGSGTGANAISGLAFVPGGQGPSVLEVPALGEIGALALTLLLGGCAFVALRRGGSVRQGR
jgi:hypothetical protein